MPEVTFQTPRFFGTISSKTAIVVSGFGRDKSVDLTIEYRRGHAKKATRSERGPSTAAAAAKALEFIRRDHFFEPLGLIESKSQYLVLKALIEVKASALDADSDDSEE